MRVYTPPATLVWGSQTRSPNPRSERTQTAELKTKAAQLNPKTSELKPKPAERKPEAAELKPKPAALKTKTARRKATSKRTTKRHNIQMAIGRERMADSESRKFWEQIWKCIAGKSRAWGIVFGQPVAEANTFV